MPSEREPKFRVAHVRSGAMTIIALHGELDLSVLPALSAEVDQILAERPLIVAVDLRGLVFMDSSGIQVLVKTARRCERLGRRFFLIRGSEEIERVLSASGLEDSFETVDQPDEVDASEIAPRSPE